MPVTPIERIVGSGYQEVIVIVRAVALVVAERGEERGMAEQFAFDVEEDGPERGVVAVGDEVARVHHEIGNAVFDHGIDDGAVDVVARARVAVDGKGVRVRRQRAES